MEPILRRSTRRETGRAESSKGSGRKIGERVRVVILAAPVILGAFGARYVHAGAPVLRLLALSTIPNGIVALGLAVARIQHRGGVLVAIQAAECVPLFGLTAILLTSRGIVGVGIAFLASQTAVAIALLASVLRPLLQSRAVHA